MLLLLLLFYWTIRYAVDGELAIEVLTAIMYGFYCHYMTENKNNRPTDKTEKQVSLYKLYNGKQQTEQILLLNKQNLL